MNTWAPGHRRRTRAVDVDYDSVGAAWTVTETGNGDITSCGPAGFDEIEVATGVVLRVDAADPQRILECQVQLDEEAPEPPPSVVLDTVAALYGPKVRNLLAAVPGDDLTCRLPVVGVPEGATAALARRAHLGQDRVAGTGPAEPALTLGRQAADLEWEQRFDEAAARWRDCAEAWDRLGDPQRRSAAMARIGRTGAPRDGRSTRRPASGPARPDDGAPGTRQRRARATRRPGLVGVVLTVIVAVLAVFGSADVVSAWVMCRGDHEIPGPARADGPLRGQSVTVAGPWTEEEEANFAKSLQLFEQQTGAEVHYDPVGREIATTIADRARADCAPDIVVVPQPGLLRELAAQGLIEPIEDVVGKIVDANYTPDWRKLGTVEGSLYGVGYKATNKSLLWYNAKLFDRLGLTPPQTWEELQHVAGVVLRAGVAPFSIGGAEGWPLTDWFENVYLQTAPELYEKLARHEILWTDDSVKRSLEILAQVFAHPDWFVGGLQGALSTDFETSVGHVFAERPQAAMVFAGDYATTFAGPGVEVGRDVKSVSFPAVADIESGSAVVAFGGDLAASVRRSPAANQLLQFLASPAAAEPWARAGGLISPNQALPLNVYPANGSAERAKALAGTTTLRYDLSDLQPGAFGSTPGQGMLRIFQDFLAHPEDVDPVATRLETERARAPIHRIEAPRTPWWDSDVRLALFACLVTAIALAFYAFGVPRLGALFRRRRAPVAV